MKKIVKDTLILFAITLVAGLGLGFVYNVTLDARNEQEELTKQEAYEEVMPGLSDYETVDLDLEDVNSYISQMVTSTEESKGISTIKEFNAQIDEVVLTNDESGNELGYIVTVTDNEAYGGSLQMTVGILTDGTVKGISFLALDETAGLGMNADKDLFKDQFKDKNVDYFEYSKTGATADNEVDAISSATITTNAVTHGVNGAIYCVDYIMGGSSNE